MEPLAKIVQKVGVIGGGERFALQDGEMDFDLVEPTGVDRGVSQQKVGAALATADGSRSFRDAEAKLAEAQERRITAELEKARDKDIGCLDSVVILFRMLLYLNVYG